MTVTVELDALENEARLAVLLGKLEEGIADAGRLTPLEDARAAMLAKFAADDD